MGLLDVAGKPSAVRSDQQVTQCMHTEIDCILIGFNQQRFFDVERRVRSMGQKSAAYTDLSSSFLMVDGVPLTLSQIWNLSVDRVSSAHRKIYFHDFFSAAIATLGSALASSGLRFECIYSFNEEKKRLEEMLLSNNILTIGITTTFYTEPYPIAEIIDFVRARNSQVRIIVGGPYVSTQVRSLDSTVLEGVLASLGGEIYATSARGERTLVEVIKALKDDTDLGKIQNLIYKTSTGYKSTSLGASNEAAYTSSEIDWSLFSSDIREFVTVRTAYSCPFTCAFCSFPEHAGKYETIAIDAVDRELTSLISMPHVRGLLFADDTLNVPPRRFKALLRALVKRGVYKPWFGNIRCQYLDRETVQLMKESGCTMAFLGLESGSPSVLKNMNKGVTVSDYERGIEMLHAAEIPTFASLVVGFPGETESTINETIAFLKRSSIDFFRANIWFCETITPIWRTGYQYNLQGENFEWSHISMDSITAAEQTVRLFAEVDGPVWVPIHEFDITSVWQLLSRGYDLSFVKSMLSLFNQEIYKRKFSPFKSAAADSSVVRRLAASLDRLDQPSQPSFSSLSEANL
jgi:anaerobic magnesium-protoporphyrin IX monomethyl ester cyclase